MARLARACASDHGARRCGGALDRLREVHADAATSSDLDRRGPRSGRHPGRRTPGPPRRALTVKVVRRTSATIRDDLEHGRRRGRAGRRSSAPTTGRASSRPTASCCRSIPTAAVKAQFPEYTLDAFSYGTAVKRLYGVPVAGREHRPGRQHEARRRSRRRSRSWRPSALAFKKKNHGDLGIAVQQGAAGDAYHMYPFFSGLGGYVFGLNKAGNLDPSDIGLANPVFLRNARLIDKWNKEGLINSKIDYGVAQERLPEGQGRLLADRAVGVRHPEGRGQVPGRPGAAIARRRCRSSASRASWSRSTPRRTASRSAAKDLVVSYMTRPAAQTQLAAAERPATRRTIKAKASPTRSWPSSGGQQGRRPDAEHPADGRACGTTSARAWVQVDEGRGRDGRPRAFRRAARNIAKKIG